MTTLSVSYQMYEVVVAGKRFKGTYWVVKNLREAAIKQGIGCSGIFAVK